jgi:hypothetical protein
MIPTPIKQRAYQRRKAAALRAQVAFLEQRGDDADAAAVRFVLKRVLKGTAPRGRWRPNGKAPAGRLRALPRLEPVELPS